MVGGVTAHHGHIPAHFLLLAQQHARFGVVAGEEDQVGVGGLQLGQDGGVVTFAGGQGIVEDDLHTGFFQGRLAFFGQALGIGGVVVQQGHLLVTGLDDGGGGGLALGVVTRTGAEEERQALFGQAHTGGAGTDLHQLGFGQDVLGGFGHGGAVGADDGHHTGGSQLLGRQGSGARVTGVVFHHQFHLAAVDAALGIGFIHEQAHDIFHVLPFGGPFARQRTHQTDLDVARQNQRRHKQGYHSQQKPELFHKVLSQRYELLQVDSISQNVQKKKPFPLSPSGAERAFHDSCNDGKKRTFFALPGIGEAGDGRKNICLLCGHRGHGHQGIRGDAVETVQGHRGVRTGLDGHLKLQRDRRQRLAAQFGGSFTRGMDHGAGFFLLTVLQRYRDLDGGVPFRLDEVSQQLHIEPARGIHARHGFLPVKDCFAHNLSRYCSF